MTSKIVIYSHGFGVRKEDGHNLFPDIAASMPEATHVMFNYCNIDDDHKSLTATSLIEQAELLKRVIADVRAEHPDSSIDLVCHSQGCVVAALLVPRNVRKIVFTAPPAELSTKDMLRLFASRPGSQVNMDGISKLNRRDGSVTLVPAAYWEDIENLDPIKEYNNLARTVPLVVINARQDEIIGSLDFSGLDHNIKVLDIDGNHDFTGESRTDLIHAVRKSLE